MRTKLRLMTVLVILLISTSINAQYLENNFQSNITTYFNALFLNQTTNGVLNEIVKDTEEKLINNTLDDHDKQITLFIQSFSYLELAINNSNLSDVVSNAKVDVTNCLLIDEKNPFCYVPAVIIYDYEGDKETALQLLNQLKEMVGSYDSDQNSVNIYNDYHLNWTHIFNKLDVLMNDL